MLPSGFHSPKQIAQALGVSESSLKRWSDQGLIQTVKTAGGHRKLSTEDVLRFARQRGIQLASPELLGLPPAEVPAESDLHEYAASLADALLKGDEPFCRQLILHLHLRGHAAARIFDEVVANAFHLIGEQWACAKADVFHERRACEIMVGILAELRRTQKLESNRLPACGGTIEGDFYTLPSMMAEIVLREAGFRATNLGTSLPFASISRAIEELRPALFWLSVSHIADEAEFTAAIGEISDTCATTDTALVMGGRAISPTLRTRLAEISMCDSMQHLATFGLSLARVGRRSLAHVGSK